MNQPKLRELIGQYGYKESNIEEMLAHLSERICECTAQGIGFPHEIGAFLGYPTADVQSFIEKEGRDFIMTGYWKVYSLSLIHIQQAPSDVQEKEIAARAEEA